MVSFSGVVIRVVVAPYKEYLIKASGLIKGVFPFLFLEEIKKDWNSFFL